MVIEPPSGFKSERDKQQWEKWKHLIYIAGRLSDIQQRSASFEQIIQALESIEEVFPKSLDPIDDFEEYAFRQFVKSIKSALLKLGPDEP